MSMSEILAEIPLLSSDEREVFFRQLLELDPNLELKETAEILAAIDAGIRSLETESGIPLEEARQIRDCTQNTNGTPSF